jgi:uncharacterized protein YraI
MLPAAPVIVGQPVEFQLEAQDNSAVALLELRLDGVLLGGSDSGPFELRWTPVEPREYLFTARATDAAGNVVERELHVMVDPDLTATATVVTPMRAAPLPPTPSPTSAPPLTVEVTVPTLNVREGPGTSFGRVGRAMKGQNLSVLGRNGDASWLRICCAGGQEGWVSSDHISYDGQVEAIPTVAAIPTPSDDRAVQSAQPPVGAQETTIAIPTYPFGPFLRDEVDEEHGRFPLKVLDRGAYEASNPVPVPREYRLVVLENEFLRLTLLPELGGRVYECIFKPTGNNQFYRNPVIKPTRWGPLTMEGSNWWLAVGGLEWGLPVEEHGYTWGVPWDYRIIPSTDGSVTVHLWESEEQRLRAGVAVTLQPGRSDFHVQITLENPAPQPVRYQFWSNGMLAPGDGNTLSSGLHFVFPAPEMTVHSSADERMPGPGEPFSWPVYQGRDVSRLSSWQGYLGFFERPAAQGDFLGVYDAAADEGLVRVFPSGVVDGAKGFAFGWGESALDPQHWTDDGSSYMELHVGITPTFSDWTELGPGQTLSWQESWFPVAGLGGITHAAQGGAVNLQAEEGGLELGIFPTRRLQADLTVELDGHIVHSAEDVGLGPASPWRQLVALPSSGADRGQVEIQLVDRSTGLPHLVMPPREVALR